MMMASTSSSSNRSSLRSSTTSISTINRAPIHPPQIEGGHTKSNFGSSSSSSRHTTASRSESANKTSLDIQTQSNNPRDSNNTQDNPRLRTSPTKDLLHRTHQQRGSTSSKSCNINNNKSNFKKHISPPTTTTRRDSSNNSIKRSSTSTRTDSPSHATSHRIPNTTAITSESESDNETHSICSTTVTASSSGGGNHNSKKSAFFKAKRKEKLRIRFDIQDSRVSSEHSSELNQQHNNLQEFQDYTSWKDVPSPGGLIIGRHRSFQVPKPALFPPRRTQQLINKSSPVTPVLLSSPSFCVGGTHHQHQTLHKFKDPSPPSSSSCTGRRGFYKLKPSVTNNNKPHRLLVSPPDHIINSSVDSGISLGNPSSSSSPGNPKLSQPSHQQPHHFLSSEQQTLVTKKPKRSLKKLLTKSRSFVLSSSSRDRDQNDQPLLQLQPSNINNHHQQILPPPSHLNSFSRAELVAKYHSNNHLEKYLYTNSNSKISSRIPPQAQSTSCSSSSVSLPRPAHNSFRVVPRSAQEIICRPVIPSPAHVVATISANNPSNSCCNNSLSLNTNNTNCCASLCQFPPTPIHPVLVNPHHTCCPSHGTTPYSPCEECKLLNVCNTLNLCRNCGGTVEEEGEENNNNEHIKSSRQSSFIKKSPSWISPRSSSTMPQPLKKAKSTSNTSFYGKHSNKHIHPFHHSPDSPHHTHHQSSSQDTLKNHGDFLSLNLSLNRLYTHHKEAGYDESSFIRTAEEPEASSSTQDQPQLPVPTDKDKSTSKKGFLQRGNKNKKSSSQEMALNRMNELVHHEQEPVDERSCSGGSSNSSNGSGTNNNCNNNVNSSTIGNGSNNNNNINSGESYHSYYDYCRIPRPKLKFVVPTHSYGVSVSANTGGSSHIGNNNTSISDFGVLGGISKSGRKNQESMQDLRGFSEVSLSSDGNDDIAYGSGGSGSGGGGGSSRFQCEIRHHSSDDTLSEFEREQEQIIMRSKHDERSHYSSQVDRIHSCEENSLALATSSLDRFPTDYTALYTCDKGIVSKGNSRRLLSFKKSYLPSLLSPTKYSSKKESGEHLEFLKSLPLFRKLSNGFLHKLTDHISEASYQCGEYILRQGSRGDGFFILISGLAKVTFLSNNHNGDEIYLRTLHPGDSFGEKSLQGDKINMMNVVATDEFVSCIIISEEGFDQLMGKSGEFRQRFSEKVPRRLIDREFERIELEDLRLISTLGIGGFGRVELVTLASEPTRSFALKQMKKCQIVATRQVEHIKSEKAILLETNCDFITKLYKTYKDSKYLYMLMECCLGGELWTILRDKGHFDDNTARFYVGCVLEALKYLHSRNIIYRDLKPENLLLDAKGYLKLVDFGFAKKLEGNKTWTFCGTPEYVAPEIILNKGHDITADYWSLGVLMYELLTGTPPFVGGDPMRTYKLILKGIDFINFPETVGKNAYNLIRKLCRENPQDRLGAQRGGLSDIKKHKWFDGLDWQGIRTKNMTPPIIPSVRGPHDCSNFDEYPPDRSGTPPDDLTGWDWDF